jgi:hypothetical protein
MKRLLGIAAFLAFTANPVFATDYVYDISPSVLAPYLTGGYVVTNCDQCVLTSANVVAWSLNQSIGASPGSLLTSSSIPQSSVLVDGTGLTATATGLFFNFRYISANYHDVTFMSPGYNFVELANYEADTNLTEPNGSILDCGSLGCASEGQNTKLEFGNFAKLESPELGASGLAPTLTLLLSGLAIVLGRSRRSG